MIGSSIKEIVVLVFQTSMHNALVNRYCKARELHPNAVSSLNMPRHLTAKEELDFLRSLGIHLQLSGSGSCILPGSNVKAD